MQRREILKFTVLALAGGLSGSLARNVMAGALPTQKVALTLFNEEQRSMVAALAELIIPKTDTPGAIEAGAPAFIEMMVQDWYKDGERKIFFDGLAGLNEFCATTYKKRFMACSAQQQTAALKDAEAKAGSYKGPMGLGFMSKQVDENTPFFTKLKELTVLGYFTSEVGSKTELSYNPMPMRYDGDYDFSKTGHQWSW